MIRLIIYLLITILILVIIVQCYFKTVEEFNMYGYTCNQCGPCAKGVGRVNCGGTSSGDCVSCTGRTYKPDSGNGECITVPANSKPTTNKQDFTCNPGYFKSGNSCSECGSCPAGKERLGCGGNSPGECELCPGNSYKPEAGTGGCTILDMRWGKKPTPDRTDWMCENGWFYDGPGCASCSWIECAAGEERVSCGVSPHWYRGQCRECRSGTYKSVSSSEACTPVPDNSTPTWNKRGWDCNAGYFKSGNSCIACGTCPEGVGRVNCSETSTGSCSPCTGQTYKSDAGNGGCENVPVNATTSDNIEWSCDPGYYKSGNSCIACSPCGAGMERRGCSGNEPGECFFCTGQTYKPNSGNDECTAVPSNSNPTTNKQDFTCNSGYYRSGDSCDACPSCSGWYTGSCGGTTNTKRCYNCPACEDNEYSTGSCGGTTNTKRCHTCPCGQIPNSSKTGCQWDNNFYLFTEYNQTGYCSKITGSVTSNDGWDRNASSFLIPPNRTLAIYNNTNCSGTCKSFTAPAGSFGHWNLSGNDASFNNAVLSINPNKGCKNWWQEVFTSGCNY